MTTEELKQVINQVLVICVIMLTGAAFLVTSILYYPWIWPVILIGGGCLLIGGCLYVILFDDTGGW